ncbi:endoribonuclease Dicer homolog 2a isoform X3 [Sorghum bicolor]|uniref:endoribonuclease Dicer homolog 2a isoform X3 n=1 Tax=Sorghum bicolor TaxID=4558 RepID=UPI000B425F7B|nr:endoribonuclease Dicer homolog 2a isoform X3 [Sorghum bicolor]|eukprot:XP_021306461.1 endoribonuclease Dicer homolog 2a isoform X3 [Sorghum bicolor]
MLSSSSLPIAPPKPHQRPVPTTMDGSASPSAAAVETDTQGGEAPSKAKRGNAEEKYQHGQPVYFPEELVDNWVSFSRHGLYYCYSINISLQGSCNTAADPTNIILAVKCDMGPDFFWHSFNSGGIGITIKYLCKIHLNQEQVIFARRFQTTVLSLLINSDHLEVSDAIKYFHELQVDVGVVYLLLPTVYGKIDWCGIKFSTSSVYDDVTDKNTRHSHSCKDADILQTMDGPCCRCILQNSVVYAPCDKKIYNITELDLNANQPLDLNNRSAVSCKRYGLHLTSESKPLLVASGLFTVQNFLYKCYEKRKEPRSVKLLPPGLCRVVMAPVSANTLFSFSFVPSIMYRIQCLLLSAKLKVQLGPRMQQFNITAMKGYIRGELFSPKKWTIPGLGYDTRGNNKVLFRTTNDMYSLDEIPIKSKRIADTVEALTGAYLSACGELAAVHFIKSLGMDVELHSKMQVERIVSTKSEEFIDVESLQTIIGYVFDDSSLLIEALTHSSYNTAGITTCNERLEFLGDAVLDYILTDYFYRKYYPKCTPALLTNLRKASVNNWCYAHAAVKAGLHKHILHSSSKQMIKDLESSGPFSGPSHGWEPGIGLPEDLADLFEAIAGAIYVDSGNDKEAVWRAMRRLLVPLATPETILLDPVSELKELCEHKNYPEPWYSPTRDDAAGVTRVVAKVKAAGREYSDTGEGPNQDVAEVFAAKALLKKLKAAARG